MLPWRLSVCIHWAQTRNGGSHYVSVPRPANVYPHVCLSAGEGTGGLGASLGSAAGLPQVETEAWTDRSTVSMAPRGGNMLLNVLPCVCSPQHGAALLAIGAPPRLSVWAGEQDPGSASF